ALGVDGDRAMRRPRLALGIRRRPVVERPGFLVTGTGYVAPHLPGVLGQAVTQPRHLIMGPTGKQAKQYLHHQNHRQQQLDHLPCQRKQQGIEQPQPEIGIADVVSEGIHCGSLLVTVQDMNAENSTSCFCSALINLPMTSCSGCRSKMSACSPATSGMYTPSAWDLLCSTRRVLTPSATWPSRATLSSRDSPWPSA